MSLPNTELSRAALSDRLHVRGREKGRLQGLANGYESMDGESWLHALKDKWNTVTLRGRSYALEALFRDSLPGGTAQGAYSYAQNLNRVPILFGVGSGGAPVGDPFNNVVFPGDAVEPINRVPFRVVDTTQPLTALAPGEELVYYGGVTVGTVTRYYLKRFEVLDPAWSFDANLLEVYKRIVCRIGNKDCRGELVNEFNFFIAEYDADNNLMLNPELLSGVTMPTQDFAPPLKQFLLEYYFYA